ncbi:tetratricopeptide repeat protein [Crocinitomix algicola]|uniref:tetratricopeptide repeat protein n=1 Tax=Crocinitomix algicola TaxID=1740263 RepID=UPI001112E261|nr:tetratricopeptide repeat protein [Crocinitomix algicola]
MKQVVLGLIVSLSMISFGQDVDELLESARAAREAENHKKAIKLLEEVIELDASIAEAHISLAYANWYEGQYEETFKGLNSAIIANPDNAYLYDTRGFFYKTIGKPNVALRDYRIALEKAETFENDTAYHSVLMNRATVYSDIREFELAYEDLLRCYHFDSTNISVLNNIAITADEVGKADETMGYLFRVIEIDSNFVAGYTNIGFHYQLREEFEASIPYFNKALELLPDEPLSLNNRSYSKMKVGDLKGAMDDVNASIDIYSANSYAYRNRGLIYLEMGKNKKACEDFNTALQLGFTEMYGMEVFNLVEKLCK